MPPIYRLQCTQCNVPPQVGGGVAGYVNMDGRKGGTVLPDAYLAVKRDDGSYVCLPHPVEEMTLEAEGFTRKQATREERLFHVTYKICRHCGVIHEEYSHCSDPFAGCLPGLIVPTVALLIFRFGLGFTWILSVSFAIATFYGLLIVFERIERRRWRSKNQKLKVRKCVSCGHEKFYTLGKASGKSLPCPTCGSKTMRCDCAGIS